MSRFVKSRAGHYVIKTLILIDQAGMASYLPSPVKVMSSIEREVIGTPSNTTRKSTMASSDTDMLRKVINLKSGVVEE